MGIVVLIGGGHAAGKKSTARLLLEEISTHFSSAKVVLLDMSDYEVKTEETIKKSTDDTPAALVIHKGGRRGTPLKPSRFNFALLKKELSASKTATEDGASTIFLVHGLYALYDKELRDMSELKVFIDSDPDTRMIRWIRRDVRPDGKSLEDVILEYLQTLRCEMNDYIFPTKEFADVIMPRGAEQNAVSLIFDGLLPYFSSNRPKSSVSRSNHLRPSDDNLIYYEVN